MEVSVGIITNGEPIISFDDHYVEHLDDRSVFTPRRSDAYAHLNNLLIGKDFHWDSSCSALIPGIITILKDNGLTLIARMDSEIYLQNVVGSEMNPLAPIEFLKASAIISRSWLYGKILDKKDNNSSQGKEDSENMIITWQDTDDHIGFDVCSDDHCQRFQGIIPISDKARDAIQSTSGMILKDSITGEIADCRFSKCCGGFTERFSTCWQNIDKPYLQSVKCDDCNPDIMSATLKERLIKSCLKSYDRATTDWMHWTRKISKADVKKHLRERFNRDIGDIISITPIKRGDSQRISLLRLVGTNGELNIGKELAIRRLLSDTHLYSSLFYISEDGDNFIISGKGWGHGVGLCQIGAAHKALKGASAEEILKFYYPSTYISY